METKESNISTRTFSERLSDAKSIYIANKKVLYQQYLKERRQGNSKQAVYVAWKKYKKHKLINRNRYALVYNSIKNEELYRKGALETNIAKVKQAYNKKKQSSITFDEKVEKERLKKRIKQLNTKYAYPISQTYRKSRTTRVDNAAFIKVPIDTPLARNVKAVLLIVLAAFLATLAMDVFVKPFGIYSAGLRGITQTIFYSIQQYKNDLPQYFSHLIFIVFNIPLAVFGYLSVGKKFTIYTLFFIVTQYFFSMVVIDLSGLDDMIRPFGKTNHEIKDIYALRKGDEAEYNYAYPIMSALIGSIIYGVAVGLLYKGGGSTGGSKFIVTWFSIKKGVSIGRIAIMISIFVVFFGILVNIVIIRHENMITSYTSITFFSTLIFAFSSNSVLDLVFARSKKEVISIITNKKDEIMHFLDVKFRYNRTFSVEKIKTNFHKKEKYKMEFLVSKTEAAVLVNVITQLDETALVTILPVRRAYGKIYSQWFE